MRCATKNGMLRRIMHESATEMNETAKQAALEVVEGARETEWHYPSFVAELFLGRIRTDLIAPYPVQSAEDRAIGDAFIEKVSTYLREHLDPEEVDRTAELPQSVINGLVALGCFGMKIPQEYGGLGFSQVNYDRVMMAIASHCTSTAVWLSAHQSIGLPQPLKMFGTKAQKEKYLPALASGKISAFALTEHDVGSDPAKMTTTAVPTDDGAAFILNGEKLWCTNGPVADYIVVVALTPPKKLTCFIVEKDMQGFEVAYRCDFMGIRGIQNGVLKFTNMRVPRENIVGAEGKGLKIALTTLNTGRLTLPASCLGAVKQCLKIVRRWSNERIQWGAPVGRHEAISQRLGRMASTVFAMEAMTWLTCGMVDRGGTDIRLEAAMAKMFCTEAAWDIVNDTMQVKGGRGYETAASLKGRGETPDPIERMMRDLRINMIFEGSSEIMRLFIAREALDPHLRVAGALFDPRAGIGAKIGAIFKMLGFYSHWYPRQWFFYATGHTRLPRDLQPHYRFVQANAHKLARALVHAMGRYGPKLERRQMVLWRAVDIGTALFAMAATCAYANERYDKAPKDRSPIALADLFCREARKRIRSDFANFTSADDARYSTLAKTFLAGNMEWLEKGIV